MKALDTNVLVRFLVNDDDAQGRRVKRLFEQAEESRNRFLITNAVVLEILWVLSAVYDFTRQEVLQALELLTELPILAFESHDGILELIRLGRDMKADLPDLLIGLSGRTAGCGTTLTFDQGLGDTGLFEQL
ncbi:MAG: type II toxin-antitoxin system VapC family toxin [bacterium]|nr:type II toxin-antitoxin system VapC family toxin [bacterium]